MTVSDLPGLDLDEGAYSHEPPLGRLAASLARWPGVRWVSIRDGMLSVTVDDEATAARVREAAAGAEVRVG
jgi:hypothetical protein